jgi:hypothetical protein
MAAVSALENDSIPRHWRPLIRLDVCATSTMLAISAENPGRGASGCCRFGQRTFAGASGNDEDAPIPDLPVLASERGGSNLSGRSSTASARLSKRSASAPLRRQRRQRRQRLAVARQIASPC